MLCRHSVYMKRDTSRGRDQGTGHVSAKPMLTVARLGVDTGNTMQIGNSHPPDDPAKVLFYRGVKALSLFFTIAFSAIFPTVVELPAFSYWETVVYCAIIGFPIASWGMYFGLRWFHAIVGQ